MNTLHAIFHGRVQGVGFRYFVQTQGRRRGLAGFVRNRADGTVEMSAQGEKGELEALLDDLKKGNGYSRVTTVDATFDAGAGEGFRGFEIRHTL